jgi:hypothetical protein
MSMRSACCPLLLSLASALILVLVGCGGSSTAPSAFSQTFSGTIPGNTNVATHPVSIPRSGTATITLSGFYAGNSPSIELRNSSGTSLGRSTCPSSNTLCGSTTLTVAVQAGSYTLLVSGGADRFSSNSYTLSVTVN